MFAILGSTSKIGRELVKELGDNAVGFSRHEPEKSETFFDFNTVNEFNLDGSKFKRAIICAGITNTAECQANASLSFDINCFKTSILIERLNRNGIPVTILSSSSVFGQYSSPPSEDCVNFSPTCRYALHKALIDDYAMNIWSKNSIIRLTKVVENTGVFFEIITKIKNGGHLKLYENLRFSPISLKFAVLAIKKIISRESVGVFHLSGEETLSYFEFANRFSRISGFSLCECLVISPEIANRNIYMPIEASLDMTRTTHMVNVFPQSINSVFGDTYG